MPNLLKEILDRIEYERLIEEGKDPSEILHHKFQNVPSDIIDSAIDADPTKKKNYSQWLLSKWDDEKDTIMNNLKNGRIAKLFNHYQNHKEIQIKDCPSVKECLLRYVPEEDTVLIKSSAPTTTLFNKRWIKDVPSELANDFDIVFDKDNWIIAVPNTYEADCKLGENMNWCTGGGRTDFEGGRSYYHDYLNDHGGKYYVNFDLSKGESRLGKDYPYTRYQFHFETEQFMDKEDDPIEPTEIDMPDSAVEFYLSEGYNLEDYDTDPIRRAERYDAQWWETSIRINEDLFLNIEYDENYVFRAPDEDTDYYVFDTERGYEPVLYACIPNPNSNDVEIVNKPGFVLLKTNLGDNVLALSNTDKNYGWEGFLLNEFAMLKDETGVCGIGRDGFFTVVSPELTSNYEKPKFNNVEKIFINKQCTSSYSAEYEENTFVEVVENEYHSLFNISISPQTGDDLICVVYRDVPVNGRYFTINENDLIEGKFRKYRVYNDEEYGDEKLEHQYDLEYEINGTGDYLISSERVDYYDRRMYNILKKGSNKPLFDTWFEAYIGYSKNLYGFKLGGKVALFRISDGKQVGKWYYRYEGVDESEDIFIGYNGYDGIDIINGFKSAVIATFDDVKGHSASCKLMLVKEDGENKLFNYVERKFCFQELTSFSEVKNGIFVCNINNTEEKCLFDFGAGKILVRGINSFEPCWAGKRYMRLGKLNGNNVFDTRKKCEVLNGDVNAIFSWYENIITYYDNGKYYAYNCESGDFLINPNGSVYPTVVNQLGQIHYIGKDYALIFGYDGSGNYRISSWQRIEGGRVVDSGSNFEPNQAPQEVVNMIRIIFGQQESITRKFKNFMRRIDEVSKYNHNDIID